MKSPDVMMFEGEGHTNYKGDCPSDTGQKIVDYEFLELFNHFYFDFNVSFIKSALVFNGN